MHYHFELPQYKPILAVFVEQRLSQRMPFDLIDRYEPQKFQGEIYLENRWSKITLSMNQKEGECLFNFTYDDPNVLQIIKIFEEEISEVWNRYCGVEI